MGLREQYSDSFTSASVGQEASPYVDYLNTSEEIAAAAAEGIVVYGMNPPVDAGQPWRVEQTTQTGGDK